MEKIEAVFFDLGGVLYSLDYGTVWESYCANCMKSPEIVKSVLYADNLFIQYELGKLSSFQYYEEVKKRLSISMSFERFKEVWNSLIIKRDDMFNLVSELKNYIKIGVLSNTNEINAEAIKNDLKGVAEHIIFSFEVGCMKPDQRIYQIVTERVDLTPEKIMFIDDQQKNVEAAREFGIHSYLYKDKEMLINFFKDYKIADELWEK